VLAFLVLLLAIAGQAGGGVIGGMRDPPRARGHAGPIAGKGGMRDPAWVGLEACGTQHGQGRGHAGPSMGHGWGMWDPAQAVAY
jgi:hypothetical protein